MTDLQSRLAEVERMIGKQVKLRRTVSESDIYLFCGISGDLHPNHIDEEYMKTTRFGQRIAHGGLTLAYMSGAITKAISDLRGTVVSYGFDNVRFRAPAFIGDTIETIYEIEEVRRDRAESRARVTCSKGAGILVTEATHILKFLD